MAKFVKILTIDDKEVYGKLIRSPSKHVSSVYNSYVLELVSSPYFNMRIWQDEVSEVIELDEVQCKLLAG